MSDYMIPAGRWNTLKGEIKSKWGALTDDDLKQIGGNIDKLIGTVQQKTGEARENVQKWLTDQGYGNALESALRGAAQNSADYAGRLGERLQEYSWSDLAGFLGNNLLLTLAGTLLVGFALGRASKGPGVNLGIGRRS
jgi:uncharacterized protein YjbJ (UPF0337 family)